jgi:hypothetical protein
LNEAQLQHVPKKSTKRKIPRTKIDVTSFQNKDFFTIGTLVFSKMKGYRTWPAKIVGIIKNKGYNVTFYGTDEHAIVSLSTLYLYCDLTMEVFGTANRESHSKKAVEFVKALDEISEAAQNV